MAATQILDPKTLRKELYDSMPKVLQNMELPE
jgi:hypothetical protein